MNRFTVAAIAAAGFAIAGSASAAVNLITNGSFEAAGTTGHNAIQFPWQYTTTDPTNSSPATIIQYNEPTGTPYPVSAFGESIPTNNAPTGSPDAAGNFAAYFVADNAKETLSQSVTLDTGIYTVGFSAYVPLNGFGNPFNATFDGDILDNPVASFSVDGSTPGKWETFSQTIDITTAGVYTATFSFDSRVPPGTQPVGNPPFPGGDVVIDQVFVVKGDVTGGGVPEPASWALMILGFGGAGAALRSQRRRQAVAA
jgi:PEP-CTERM motif